MLETIIKAIEEATGMTVKPLGSNNLEECICYTWTPSSDNGAVRVVELELRIITKTISTAEQARPQILSTLVTVGDEGKLGYNQCYLNGGGQVYDPETKLYHTVMYLYITTKSEVRRNG